MYEYIIATVHQNTSTVLYVYIAIMLHAPANHQQTSQRAHPPTTAWQPRIREAEDPPALVRQRDEALVAGQEEGRRVRAGTHARVQLHRRALGHHAVKAHDLTHVAFGASAIIERDGRDVDVYKTDLLTGVTWTCTQLTCCIAMFFTVLLNVQTPCSK